MSIFSLMSNRYQSLTKAERRVADYVRRNPAEVILMSLQELAENCETSDATVLRFCHKMGFSGYQDFKSTLLPELLESGLSVHGVINDSNEQELPFLNYTQNLISDLQNTLYNVNKDTVETVVERMIGSGRIIILGLAGSAGVGRIFCDSLLSVEKPAVYLSDRVEIERVSSLAGKEEMLFGISHSGETMEVCRAVERAKSRDCFTVGITNFAPSSLNSAADAVLLTSINENPMGSYSCIPRIAQLAVLELLTGLVIKRMH